MEYKFPYDKYLIVGGIIMLVIVILAMSMCSCSFFVKELPLEEKIAEDVFKDVVNDIEGNSK